MSRIASAIELLVGWATGVWIFCPAAIAAWFAGTALGFSISGSHLYIFCFPGVLCFFFGPILHWSLLPLWPALATALIGGVRIESILARVMIIAGIFGTGIWAGHLLASVS